MINGQVEITCSSKEIEAENIGETWQILSRKIEYEHG